MNDDLLIEAIEHFSDQNILVFGDLMLDEYVTGEVKRISPEAPVPIFRENERFYKPGGAANVALNLKKLGASVTLIGIIGEDNYGKTLIDELQKNGINCDYIVTDKNRVTTRKTRVVSQNQQLIRIDSENDSSISDSVAGEILGKAEKIISNFNYTIVSDYNKGICTYSLTSDFISLANKNKVKVLVDPKDNNFDKYKDAYIITPNEKELKSALQTAFGEPPDIFADSGKLSNKLNIKYLVVTRGEHGILLLDVKKDVPVKHFEATAKEVYDVSGAGDTVISTLALSLSSGLTIDDAIALSNIAAGYVISKFGTYSISKQELINEVKGRNHTSYRAKTEDVFHQINTWKSRNEKIVFTNGCFDLLHSGHIQYLEEAKKLGDKLIVAINSDASVRQLKGESRPIINQIDRAKLLSSLSFVDAVLIFDESTPLNLINKVRPDFLVKGQDYKKEEVVGAKEVESRGGKVILMPLVDGLSTSNIIKKIIESSKNAQ